MKVVTLIGRSGREQGAVRDIIPWRPHGGSNLICSQDPHLCHSVKEPEIIIYVYVHIERTDYTAVRSHCSSRSIESVWAELKMNRVPYRVRNTVLN